LLVDDRPAAVYVALGLGVVSFALSPILVRWASAAPGLAIAVWRTGLAVLLLAPAVWAHRSTRRAWRAFTWRDVGLIGTAGVFLGLHFITWIESLYHTSVASASVLVTTSPVFLAALGYLVLGERLSRVTLAGIGVAVGGAALIGVGDAEALTYGAGALWGNGLALSAALLVSLYLLIGRVVRRKTGWLAYVAPLYAVAAATALLAALVQGVPLLTYGWPFYGLCLLMAIGPQLLGHGSFNYALKFFPAALVGMLALLEPVGASVLAYVLFGEAPTPLAMVGMTVVLAGVAVVVWKRRSRRPATQEAPASKDAERAASPSGTAEGASNT
jgi:drug/metabolite transporter (DMT)-like permease